MLPLTVRDKREVAVDTWLFDLVSDTPGVPLPAFTAGAHVVLLTPTGLTRRYSLCNPPSEREHYQVAIKREAAGMGGSVGMIDRVRVGDRVMVSPPENYFPLDSQVPSCLLIAGGIGITPILSMAHALAESGRDFQLLYCTRSPESTAFAEQMTAAPFVGRTTLHHDHGERSRSYDLAALLATQPAQTHLYCCGPAPLMHAVREHSRHWAHGTVHFEDFGSTVKVDKPGDKAFDVVLARQGRTLHVAANTSILDALRQQGVQVPSSCESGTCGACRTGLLEGVGEHRDYVLDDEEQAREIMICVSRARSERLVLDV